MHIWCAKLEPDEQKFEGVGRFTAEKSCCSCKTPHRIGTGNASIMNLSPLVFFWGNKPGFPWETFPSWDNFVYKIVSNLVFYTQ